MGFITFLGISLVLMLIQNQTAARVILTENSKGNNEMDDASPMLHEQFEL